MKIETTIYVELMEGIAPPVFAPVPAIHLGNRFYKIVEHNRDDYDTLRFNTGECVVCLLSKFELEEDLVPVAYCTISEQAVVHILGFEKIENAT